MDEFIFWVWQLTIDNGQWTMGQPACLVKASVLGAGGQWTMDNLPAW
jgi:hypothetical protein